MLNLQSLFVDLCRPDLVASRVRRDLVLDLQSLKLETPGEPPFLFAVAFVLLLISGSHSHPGRSPSPVLAVSDPRRESKIS